MTYSDRRLIWLPPSENYSTAFLWLPRGSKTLALQSVSNLAVYTTLGLGDGLKLTSLKKINRL